MKAIRLPLEKLLPGMVLAEQVKTMDGSVLSESGSPITRQLLEVYELWGIHEVPVYQGRQSLESYGSTKGSDENGFFSVRFKYDPEKVFVSKKRAAELHGSARALSQKLFERIQEGKSPVERGKIQGLADKLIASSLDSPQVTTAMARLQSYDNYLMAHSINVAILSVLIGTELKLSMEELSDLAEGALLHDVGMIRIKPSLWNKEGKLTAEEKKEIQKHCLYSLTVSRTLIKEEPGIEAILLQHHERMDGSGYPQGLDGEAIHPLARIVAVADIFEAMNSERKYRRRFLPYSVMSHLMQSGGATLDSHVVQAFVHHMSVYPIGSLVKLNTGEIGVVVSSNPKTPIRPHVKLLLDRDGQRLHTMVVVDLSHERRFVKEPVDEEKLGINILEVF